jgi:hypothetical protein
MSVSAEEEGSLVQIGFDERCSSVFMPVGSLGVYDYRLAQSSRPADEPSGQRRRNDALGIIGEQTGIDLGQAFVDEGTETFFEGRRQELAAFVVESRHLLAVSDDARLGGGWPARIDEQARNVDAASRQRRAQAFARFIAADDSRQEDFGAQAGGIGSGIGCAAGDEGALLHLDDGNGCFGREAVRGAPQVFVEHDVADHEQPHAGELLDESVHDGLFVGVPPSGGFACPSRCGDAQGHWHEEGRPCR